MVSSIRLRSNKRGAISQRLVALLAALAWAAPVEAGDASEVRARAQFRAGQNAYEAGEYEGALKAFSEAYGLQPVPGLLFNIAQCHRQLGNYERAAVFYQQYLELAPSRENDAAVRALLGQAQALDREQKRKVAEEQALRQKQLKARLASRAPPSDLVLDRPSGARDASAQKSEPGNSILKKWWFWTGIGVVAAGTTAYLVASQHSNDASLGTVNVR